MILKFAQTKLPYVLKIQRNYYTSTRMNKYNDIYGRDLLQIYYAY